MPVLEPGRTPNTHTDLKQQKKMRCEARKALNTMQGGHQDWKTGAPGTVLHPPGALPGVLGRQTTGVEGEGGGFRGAWTRLVTTKF